MSKIRRIHDFGPEVGEWKRGADLRKRFEDWRREQAKARKQKEQTPPNVVPIQRESK